ncbi:MAG: hypothetical protein JSV72_18505 [Ralstonia sp.]|nr:MAG: hypothetical protein JSV72_18505 [Ralstonia sp.]
MNPAKTVTQKELFDFLLNAAVARPVFIWGAPGIGKSSIVQQFAAQLGLPCVSLLGSQLAPEDIIVCLPKTRSALRRKDLASSPVWTCRAIMPVVTENVVRANSRDRR